MARQIKVLCASEDVKTELRRRANGRSNEHRKRFRAEIILLRLQIEDVATRLNTSLRTVSIWSSRFEAAGLAGVDDKRGQGRRPSLPEAKVARVLGWMWPEKAPRIRETPSMTRSFPLNFWISLRSLRMR